MLGDEFSSYKSHVNFTAEHKLKVLEDVLEETAKSKNRLDDKSWAVKWKNGKKVTARDVLRKAAKWVNHFKEVVDVAVSFDPVHAALPWAGIRFLLTVTKPGILILISPNHSC